MPGMGHVRFEILRGLPDLHHETASRLFGVEQIVEGEAALLFLGFLGPGPVPLVEAGPVVGVDLE